MKYLAILYGLLIVVCIIYYGSLIKPTNYDPRMQMIYEEGLLTLEQTQQAIDRELIKPVNHSPVGWVILLGITFIFFCKYMFRLIKIVNKWVGSSIFVQIFVAVALLIINPVIAIVCCFMWWLFNKHLNKR